jgi:type II secretory pathway component PulJ
VNWEAISAIGQLVGALAVVISLIYLARQVRSNAHATREAAMRSTLDSVNRHIQQITERPDLAELRSRGFADFESLEGTNRTRFGSLMHQLFRNAENMYCQHLEGHLDPRLWRGLEVVMREVNAQPGVQAWWRLRSHWFDEEFAKFINQQQQTATRHDD